MKPLAKWMRWTLFLAAIYNGFGVLLFLPLLSLGRRITGIPGAHPFYLAADFMDWKLCDSLCLVGRDRTL
ncbi:MAG TPA: hypothetical protein VGQ70_07790 [Candidatus Udaeobacter sp.]|nr:hypothetical protein [Candidatus Udaeobacter sp.]